MQEGESIKVEKGGLYRVYMHVSCAIGDFYGCIDGEWHQMLWLRGTGPYSHSLSTSAIMRLDEGAEITMEANGSWMQSWFHVFETNEEE